MLKILRKNKKGFTLTELIVVVAILGVLAAISIPMVTSYISDSKITADTANAKLIEGVLKRCDARGKDASGATFKGITVATAAELKTAVVAELGSMPVGAQKNATGTVYQFYLTPATGAVAALDPDTSPTGTVVGP